MSIKRFCAGVLLTASLVGCKATSPQSSGLSPTTLPSARAVTPAEKAKAAHDLYALPDTDRPAAAGATDTKPGADALAQATADYAKAMEKLIAIRNAAATHSTTAPSTTGNLPGANGLPPAPSLVQFDNASRDRVAPDARANAAAATAGAAIPANNPPEQIASVTPPAGTGGPAPSPAPTVTQTPSRADVMFNKDSAAPNVAWPPGVAIGKDDLAQKFAKQVKDYPQDVSAQLDWQLLQLLQGQPVPQLQTISSLSGEDREMLSAVLDGLTNFRNSLKADNNMLLSRKIRPMMEMAERLRQQGELSIPTVALCTDVKGFGVYEPLEPARFPADNKEHRVIVYCEVENFSSQLDEQKRWQTKLTQEVVLYTEQNGLEVWRDKAPSKPIIDYSRNRRHDFFIVKLVRLPPNLTIGRYLLKVSVVDQQVNRVAENSVPVQIVAE